GARRASRTWRSRAGAPARPSWRRRARPEESGGNREERPGGLRGRRPAAFMPGIEFFQPTDVGCVREGNEDAVGHWPHEDGLLIAVADGLGGHAAGEVASALALEVLAPEMDRAPGSWALTKRLRRAVQEANLELYKKAVAVPELPRKGPTRRRPPAGPSCGGRARRAARTT